MNYCFGCMRNKAAGETVCPVCGYRHESATWPAFALRPGTLLHNGKYLIGKVLGQGGFGITYIGLDTALELKVAIKEYYPMNQVNRSSVTDEVLWHSASDGGSSGRESFLKEARRMARVDAIPGIVQVRDIFYQKNTAYIVMNFIEGETLKEKLLRDGAMTPEECVRTLTPVMEALEKAHRKGLIHRDISPDNIMIDREGQLWILDMGAAKDLDSANGPTQSSQAVTKRGFSPPEQSIGSGRGKIGPWTDVYAMCATIYYCLTGRLVPEAMERFLDDELSFPANLPDPMVSTLRHGLALRAEERIQTMEQLLEELKEKVERSQLHKDESQRQEKKREVLSPLPRRADIAVGDVVSFGRYEQNSSQNNGKEKIEWQVLDVKSGKALLISRYAIDCQPYNTEFTAVTWETCSLRSWLNRTFLNVAFSAEEQKAIMTISVDNSRSQGNSQWNTNGGKDTEDRIFLLSYAELERYFCSNNLRTCNPTPFAVAKNTYTDSDNGKCWWWLRSPGFDQNFAAYVFTDGSLGYFTYVNRASGAVRPALWVDLESAIF